MLLFFQNKGPVSKILWHVMVKEHTAKNVTVIPCLLMSHLMSHLSGISCMMIKTTTNPVERCDLMIKPKAHLQLKSIQMHFLSHSIIVCCKSMKKLFELKWKLWSTAHFLQNTTVVSIYGYI